MLTEYPLYLIAKLFRDDTQCFFIAYKIKDDDGKVKKYFPTVLYGFWPSFFIYFFNLRPLWRFSTTLPIQVIVGHSVK